MSNDYFKAQGWFKTYALNSQDSRGVFQELVKEDEEAFRLASAESDKIKAMMNEKYGSGTIKYGSEIKQPEIKTPQAAFEFSQRNPAAEGGRMRFDNGLSAKMSYNERTKLLDSYHDFFKEAYDERVKIGEPFGKSDLVRDVIKKIELKYPDQADNLDFFPGGTKDVADKGKIQVYLEYITPKKQSSKFRIKNSLANTLTEEQMSVFKGNEARGLKQTKSQEKIFKALQNGINEIDDLVKETGMTKSRINQETAKLVNNMFVRTNETPMFLRGEDAQNAISDVYNSLVDSKTMAGFHTRNIKSMIYDSFPNDPEIRKLALSKVKKFTEFTNDLKKQFPGLEINYDHPGSYRALKNLDFKNFLNVTPISKDINAFKSRFDNQSVKNLNDLAEAKEKYGPNSPEYKTALKKQRSLERVWSNLTGNKSSLGKIRLNRQSTGTVGLETEGKNLVEEFTGNLKIREEIAKNIDESVKFYDPNSKTEKTIFESFEEVLPTKRGTTASIEAAKKITSSDSLDFDKKIMNYITDTTGKVKQPMLSSGFAGAYEMLSDDLKPILNDPKFKAFKAAAKAPGKLFGIGDVVLGYLDYKNNISQGMTEERAKKLAYQAMSFGIYRGGDEQYIKELKDTYLKEGGDESVFDQVINLNKQNADLMQTVENTKKNYKKNLENKKTFGNTIGNVGLKYQVDLPTASEQLKLDLNSIKSKAENMDKNFTTFKETYTGEDLTKPSKDIKSAAFENLTKERLKSFDEKSLQSDTEVGSIWNSLRTNLLNTQSIPRTLTTAVDFINPFTPLPKLDDLRSDRARYEAQLKEMKEKYPREFYLENLQRGMDRDNPITMDAAANLMSKKELGFSEGGITELRSKYEYKK